MARTKINYRCPDTGKRKIGILNPKTNMVTIGFMKTKPLSELEAIDTNGIGYFETRIDGAIVQKVGRYEG